MPLVNQPARYVSPIQATALGIPDGALAQTIVRCDSHFNLRHGFDQPSRGSLQWRDRPSRPTSWSGKASEAFVALEDFDRVVSAGEIVAGLVFESLDPLALLENR